MEELLTLIGQMITVVIVFFGACTAAEYAQEYVFRKRLERLQRLKRGGTMANPLEQLESKGEQE